jgi:ribonuclease E
MSINDAPTGDSGGPVSLPELPEKLRVHALAKLIGRTSKEVLTALADLGNAARSAQSSVDRKTAEQVVSALVPDSGGAAAPESPVLAESPADPVIEDAAPVAEPAAAPAGEVEDAAAPAEKTGPLAPLFAPPAAVFQPPAAKPARSRRKAAEPVEEPAAETPAVPAPAPEEEAEGPSTTGPEDADQDQDSDEDSRRRRRRGRRGRGRGKGQDEENGESDAVDEQAESTADAAPERVAAEPAAAEQEAEDSEDSEDTEDETDGADAGGTRRRRRRRRRKGSGDGADDRTDDDPPNTVTRVRAPRETRERDTRDDSDDGVQSVRGSTRLEAKRQRRRDGRDAGRRRVPILSEAEFLARRESVDRTMVVRQQGSRTEIGVLEDDILVEHFVASAGSGGNDKTGNTSKSIVGNIYLGRVQNVLPSMEAAFVDIGRGRNAVLYAGEVDWDAAGLNGKARRIEQALSSGDSVLVQVTKDPIGHKGARLTTQISLAGRFLVYVPSGGAAGISRKLPDVERKRLKDMLKEIVPSEAGVIIRTASEGVSHEALERDVRRLQAQWEVVKEKSEKTGPNRPKAPTLLYEEPDLLVKVVRDQFNEDFTALVVSGDEAWETVSAYIGHVAPELKERLHRHVGPKDVFAEYRIDEQLLKALDRKVWLPSGGTLVIDRTEAMTVVDVNTGKFTGSGGNLEETVTRNNLEAAEEIVRQLRLRDIGGIIVIDFIDMVLEANRDLVLRRLTECLARDRTRHQVAEVTSLGLVQMTRKRVGGGLLEHFSAPCEHCRGRGVVITTDPVEQARQDHGPGSTNGQANGSDSGAGSGEVGGRRRNRGRRGGDQDQDRTPAPVEEAPVEKAPVEKAPVDTVNEVTAPNVVAAVAGAAAVAAASRSTEKAAAAAVETGTPAVPPVEDTPVEDTSVAPAQAQEAPSEEAPSRGRRRSRRREERAEVPVDATNGAVEVAESAAPSAPVPDAPAPVEAPVTDGNLNGHSHAPTAEPQTPPAKPERRKRARVTRSAGAPAGAEAAVLTAPAGGTPNGTGTVDAGSEVAVVTAPVPVQPEPAAVTTRPRRSRRAASRPAGPPVDAGTGSDTTGSENPSAENVSAENTAGTNGGDPV